MVEVIRKATYNLLLETVRYKMVSHPAVGVELIWLISLNKGQLADVFMSYYLQ